MKLNKKPLPYVSPPTLNSILSFQVSGFERLDVRIDNIRIAESESGRFRFAVLIARGMNSRLHQSYLVATALMFKHYKLGSSPLSGSFYEPEDLRRTHTAIYNHIKPVLPSLSAKYLEFIHVQAERIYGKYSGLSGYWTQYTMDVPKPL